jgi:hypothetical protein
MSEKDFQTSGNKSMISVRLPLMSAKVPLTSGKDFLNPVKNYLTSENITLMSGNVFLNPVEPPLISAEVPLLSVEVSLKVAKELAMSGNLLKYNALNSILNKKQLQLWEVQTMFRLPIWTLTRGNPI